MKHASYSTFSIFSYYSIWYLEFIDTTLIFTYPVDPLSPVGFFFPANHVLNLGFLLHVCATLLFFFLPQSLCRRSLRRLTTSATSYTPGRPTPQRASSTNLSHAHTRHHAPCVSNPRATFCHCVWRRVWHHFTKQFLSLHSLVFWFHICPKFFSFE